MTKGISKSFQNFTLKFRKPNRTKNVIENQIKSIRYSQLFQYATWVDKLCIFIGIICSIINGLAFTLLMFGFGDCIDGIIEYASFEQNYTNQEENALHLHNMNDKLWIYIYQCLCSGLTLVSSGYLSVVLFSYSATRQIFKIKVKFMEKILYQDVSWFDLNQCGDISTTLTHNLSKMEDGMGDLVAVYLYLSTTIVAGIVLSLIKGWKLALVGSLSLVLFITLSFIISWFSRKFTEQEIELYGAAGAIAEEVLTSIKTVVAFEGQEKEKLRYEKHLIKAKANNIKRGFWNGFGKGIYLFLGYSGFALAFWVGVKLIIEDKYLPLEDRVYTPSSLFTIFFLILTAFWNWEFMPPLFENIAGAVGASKKVFFVLKSTSILKRDENNGQTLNVLSSNITFDNVYFNYPSRPDVKVLQGFNLKINKGETVALVGSSGCGKSTCIQLIQRFYDPMRGRILIDNIDLKDVNSKSLKKIIGVVGQEPALFGTTIYENIRYGKLTATREEIEDAAQKANVHTFILSLPMGYQTLLGERGTQISGGQKQKIAIARALVKQPQILLLDEATSALDTTSEKEIQDSLNSVSDTCTTIIVAHRLTTIKQANKIVVVQKGKVIEVGSHIELLDRKGAYYDLVNSQIKSIEEVEDEEKIISKIGTKNVESISIVNGCEEEEEVKDGINVNDKFKSKRVFWKIMKMNSSQWYYVLPGCICAVISGTALPFYGMILGIIMQVLSNQNDEELIAGMNTCCVYYLILGIVIGISAFLQSFSLCLASEKLSLNIKSQSFDAMLKQEIGWFDRKENRVGALCSQLSGDAMHIQGVSGYQLGMICQVFSILFFSIAFSFYSEWRVALLLFIFSMLIFLVSYFQQKMLEYDAKKNRKMLVASVKLAAEAISNIRTVASLGCEKAFLDQYVKELLKYQKVAIKKSHIRGIVIGLVNSLIIWLYPLGLWYGVQLIITENVAYGKVLTVCELMLFGLWCAGNMMAACPNFQKGLIAASRVIRLLERVPDIRNSTNPLQISWENETIDYSKIYFSYPTRPSKLILKELFLTVTKGKTIALVGSSGCGKSTIIQLLQRFYDPNSGEIIISGTDTKKIDLKLLRSQWGVVSQEPNLFDKTIAENIAYGANFKNVEMDAIIAAAKDANIHNFIASLPKGYETRIGSKGSQLSGGQKQRIAIARALVRNPKILLLDEATSALDNDSEKIVQEALDKARKGRTCITIAHRLTTIQDADIICVLKDGAIVEMGTHEELFKIKGFYYKFYRLQSESLTS